MKSIAGTVRTEFPKSAKHRTVAHTKSRRDMSAPKQHIPKHLKRSARLVHPVRAAPTQVHLFMFTVADLTEKCS